MCRLAGCAAHVLCKYKKMYCHLTHTPQCCNNCKHLCSVSGMEPKLLAFICCYVCNRIAAGALLPLLLLLAPSKVPACCSVVQHLPGTRQSGRSFRNPPSHFLGNWLHCHAAASHTACCRVATASPPRVQCASKASHQDSNPAIKTTRYSGLKTFTVCDVRKVLL